MTTYDNKGIKGAQLKSIAQQLATKIKTKQGTVSTDTDSSAFSDATEIATGFGSDKIHFNVASRLWNYIKGKLGISSSGSSTKFLNEQGEWTTVTTADVSGKADKVANATAGDVATLDANGNLVDSGVTLDPSTNTIAANISGNATTATTASSTSSGSIGGGDDLNSYNTANRNYQCNATNSSTVSNKPSGASGAFELEVIRGTGDTCVQVYYSRDDVNFNYIRKRNGNDAWTGWIKLIDSSDVISPNYSAATLAYNASGESLLFNLSKVSVYGEISSTSYCQLKIVPNSGSVRADRSVIKSFNSNFDSFRIYNYPWSSSPGRNAYTPNITYDNNNIGTIDIDLVTTQTDVIHLTVWYIADTAARLYRFYIVEEVKT